jgi:hypothetical protein
LITVLGTYQGVSTIIPKAFDWKRSRIPMLEVEAVPQSCIPSTFHCIHTKQDAALKNKKPLYTCFYSVLVQIANKMGLQKKNSMRLKSQGLSLSYSLLPCPRSLR